MGLRRRKKTLNEELLEAGPRDADVDNAPIKKGRSGLPTWLVVILFLAGAILLPALHWVVGFLPSWAAAIVGFLVVIHYVSIFRRSTKGRLPSAGGVKPLRAAFLLSLAAAVSVTVLVAIAGFQEDDRVLLGIVWPVVGLIWVADRLRASRSQPAR